MADLFDSVMDAVSKFADGCSNMEQRMDALEKRRTDAVGKVIAKGTYDHHKVAGEHIRMASYHHDMSGKKGRGSSPELSQKHTQASILHTNAATHHFNAHMAKETNHQSYDVHAKHAVTASNAAKKASEAL